jgi:hypothetical protein
LTAYDDLKQPGVTSICGTSGVMKVSALLDPLRSMQHIAAARSIAAASARARRARARR